MEKDVLAVLLVAAIVLFVAISAVCVCIDQFLIAAIFSILSIISLILVTMM